MIIWYALQDYMDVFTTSTADNIDYNPSSTALNKSFHDTGISPFQHLMVHFEGVE